MLKLEIGPHANKRTPDNTPEGTWHTADSNYDCTFRCRWGVDSFPVTPDSYDWVYASHVLEHLPWWQVLQALREVFRILKPNGRFTVWVPDAVKIVGMAAQSPEKLVEAERGWKHGHKINPEHSPWVYMNARVFWGARPGEVGQEQHFHRSMFGKESLQLLLQQAGFKSVAEAERKESELGHGWMEVGMEATK